MPLFRPDILEHANPNQALADSKSFRGGIQHFANFTERNAWPLDKRGKMLAIVYGADENDAQRGSWVYEGANFTNTEWVKEDNWKLFGGNNRNIISELKELKKSHYKISKNTTLTSIHDGKHIYVISDGVELTTAISDFMCTVETADGVSCKINGEALGANQMTSFRRFDGVDKPLKPVDTDA